MQFDMPEIAVKNRVPVEALRKVLSYDPTKGELRWLPREPITANDRSWNTRWAGKLAGTYIAKGYPMVEHRGFCLACHRVAWALHYGEWPDTELDHENTDKTDYRIKNLRKATRTLNGLNNAHVKRRSPYPKGVSLHRFSGLYRAYQSVKGKQVSFGYFKTPEEASAAYEANAKPLLELEIARMKAND